MSDSADNQVIVQSIQSPDFQSRCYFRFLAVAIGVASEPTTTPQHDARVGFAGALFSNNVPRDMLAASTLADATLRSQVLANPQQAGGNVTDSALDAQVSALFTNLAASRIWT